MKGICGVYRLTNTVSGKSYVGSSIEIRGRMYQHFSQLRLGIHKNAHLQAAFVKDGEESFRVELLEECAKEDLLVCEQRHLDALLPEYNILPIAGNSMGYRHTQEGRIKMSVANKGNQRFLGKTHSAETRLKISASRVGIKLTPDHVARIKEANLGNKHTAGRTLSKEHRAKVSEASLRMWQEDGRRLRRAVETKALWANPAWKTQQLAKIAAGRAAKRSVRGVE